MYSTLISIDNEPSNNNNFALPPSFIFKCLNTSRKFRIINATPHIDRCEWNIIAFQQKVRRWNRIKLDQISWDNVWESTTLKLTSLPPPLPPESTTYGIAVRYYQHFLLTFSKFLKWSCLNLIIDTCSIMHDLRNLQQPVSVEI